MQVGGSPLYVVERKLGKGGFGQVYLGRRTPPSKDPELAGVNQVGRLGGERRSIWGCGVEMAIGDRWDHMATSAAD